MIASRDNCYLPSLMWVALALAAILLGIANFDALRVNLIFLGLERVLSDPDMTLEQKATKLRDIRLLGDQVPNSISMRPRNALTSVDRMLAQVDHQSTVYSTLSNWSALDWKPWRLPNAVPLGANVSLLGVIVISDDADFSLGNPIRLALLLQLNQLDVQARQVKFDSVGWSVIETPAGWVAFGSLPNWMQNAGFEWPSLINSHVIQGLLPTKFWGLGGVDSWQRLHLWESDDGLRGQVACVSGEVRLSTVFRPMEKEGWMIYGATFRTTRGKSVTPYLIAVSHDGSVQDIGSLSVVRNTSVNDGWYFGYGIVHLSADESVSMFLDGVGGVDNETCLDNLFLLTLPDLFGN